MVITTKGTLATMQRQLDYVLGHSCIDSSEIPSLSIMIWARATETQRKEAIQCQESLPSLHWRSTYCD